MPAALSVRAAMVTQGGWSALTVYADSTVRGMCGYYYVREDMAGQRQGNEVAVCGDE